MERDLRGNLVMNIRFVSLQGSTASICDSVNAELHEVAVADLRGLPSLAPKTWTSESIGYEPSPS
jgi:hypothetical protein